MSSMIITGIVFSVLGGLLIGWGIDDNSNGGKLCGGVLLALGIVLVMAGIYLAA